jgi:cytolethal distending toxin subunit B
MQGSSHSTENKWNTGVANLIGRGEADVVALQEAGSVPDSAVHHHDTRLNLDAMTYTV